MRTKSELSTKFIVADPHKCKSCWACYETCKKNVFGKVNVLFGLHKHVKIVNPDACVGCLQCVKTCQYEANTAVKR